MGDLAVNVNIKSFYKYNIIDSCSISNILSSEKLYNAALYSGCCFYCTKFVIYECLFKKSKTENYVFQEFKRRFDLARRDNKFETFDISIEDLQEISLLESRKKLSKGELSSMVFAKKTQQAFITDDKKAKKLATGYLEQNMVQTIPQLFGWLIYTSVLNDQDKIDIINDHKKMGRPLEKYLNRIYLWALELKLVK
jgi:predicted nucleic acid-binding protein